DLVDAPVAAAGLVAHGRDATPTVRPRVRSGLHRRDQDVGDLGAAELGRRALALRQHLPHLRAGKRNTVLGLVRTGLRRAHTLALVAPERVLEHQRLDAELAGLELLEDLLRVVRAVVRADARVITSDDEVRAPVVLAGDRVPDRLARARVAHRRGEHADHRAVVRVVATEQ